MTPRRIFGVLVVALLGYEAYTLGNAAPGDTISEIVWDLSDRWQVVTFAFGLLAGHWFWPRLLGGASARGGGSGAPAVFPAVVGLSSPQPPLSGPLERRTEAGTLLRAGLDAIERQAMTVPEGRRGVVAVVLDETGAEVGAAFLTKRGWTVEASVRAAVKDGRKVQAALKVTF